jgi:ketosteroid isomerase-like protein
MSGENVEVIERGVDAFNAEDTDGFVDLWDPDCEFFSVTGSQMDATPYRGHDGIRRYRRETEETWVELRLAMDRILEGKNTDVVVAVGCLRGEGRGSGVLVEQRIGMVFELREGKVRYCRAYSDPDEALEAVGRRE